MKELGAIRIVMVDDDADDIFLTRVACKRSDVPIEFTGVNSGEALYDYIKYNGIGSIDVILLDVNMPIENGYQVLKKLTLYPNIGDVSILMFSTSKRPHEKELALELGVYDFIVKPSGVKEVDQFINRLQECYNNKLQPLLQASE